MRDGIYWIGSAAIVQQQEVHPVRYLCTADENSVLPFIEIVVPVQRSSAGSRPIRIDCLQELDYPRQLLTVTVAIDGPCPEAIDGIVRRAELLETSGIAVTVVRHPQHRGQITVLDEAIAASVADVVALTELLVPLSPDILKKLARVHIDGLEARTSAHVVAFPARP